MSTSEVSLIRGDGELSIDAQLVGERVHRSLSAALLTPNSRHQHGVQGVSIWRALAAVDTSAIFCAGEGSTSSAADAVTTPGRRKGSRNEQGDAEGDNATATMVK